MRKPRDFDFALKALNDKTKALKENKRRQLGELIVVTGADALDMEILAGGLLAMAKTGDATEKEGWRKQGAAFFRKASAAKTRTPLDPNSDAARDGSKAPPSSPARKI